ncbi:hypothetical protein JTB14_027591 [Gonioctena quinquepunctata]|nr:hypothetical protein JTB14_027591 [Gonioctena quinquepunctata]
MNGPYRSHHPPHQQYQKQQNCGRIHDREWENPVNGRAKQRSSSAPVPALTSSVVDGKRKTRPAAGKAKVPMDMHAAQSARTHAQSGRAKIKPPSAGSNAQKHVSQRNCNVVQDRMKGVLGYQQSASACFFDAGASMRASGGVYGVYAETKYVYAVNGLPENHAQASAAAAFFAR